MLVPLAKEYGLSATFEEFREYAGSFSGGADGELSDDELTQVAGGKGSGGFVCGIVGAGFGNTGNPNDNCFFLGMGIGACFTEGATY